MKSYIIFSSREPFLIVTQNSIRDRKVIDHLRRIGCTKFISREVPIDHIRGRYGRRFRTSTCPVSAEPTVAIPWSPERERCLDSTTPAGSGPDGPREGM